MKKYRAAFGKIEEVEILRETSKFVVFSDNGRRDAKTSDWQSYFDTWEEAKQCLLNRAEMTLKLCTRSYERAQEDYNKVSSLTKQSAL